MEASLSSLRLSRATKTILLAEEDDDTREELAHELRCDGYHVVTVEDGFELCDYLLLAKQTEGRVPGPDVIVSDVDLSGYTGLEICRIVGAAEDAAPVILLADWDDSLSWQNGERAGAARIIDKPVSMPRLLDAVACFAEGA